MSTFHGISTYLMNIIGIYQIHFSKWIIVPNCFYYFMILTSKHRMGPYFFIVLCFLVEQWLLPHSHGIKEKKEI